MRFAKVSIWQSSGRANGRKCPEFPTRTEASMFPCRALTEQADSSTTQLALDSAYRIVLPQVNSQTATASPLRSPDTEATIRSSFGHNIFFVEITAEFLWEIREASKSGSTWAPATFPELHCFVLVAGTGVGLTCAWLYPKLPPGPQGLSCRCCKWP